MYLRSAASGMGPSCYLIALHLTCTISSRLHSDSMPDWGFTLNTLILMLHTNIETE